MCVCTPFLCRRSRKYIVNFYHRFRRIARSIKRKVVIRTFLNFVRIRQRLHFHIVSIEGLAKIQLYVLSLSLQEPAQGDLGF